jgi:hypothetical protein
MGISCRTYSSGGYSLAVIGKTGEALWHPEKFFRHASREEVQ